MGPVNMCLLLPRRIISITPGFPRLGAPAAGSAFRNVIVAIRSGDEVETGVVRPARVVTRSNCCDPSPEFQDSTMESALKRSIDGYKG
jgi:hypothetical protein